MNRGFFGILCFVGVMSAFAVACGGESTEFSDHDDETGGKGGGGATGGSSAKGGSSGTTGNGGTAGKGGQGRTDEASDGVGQDNTGLGRRPGSNRDLNQHLFRTVNPFFDQPGCENSPGRA